MEDKNSQHNVHHHPPPVYLPLNRPFGLQKLMYLDKICVRQKATNFANKYTVSRHDGEVIFNVKEDAPHLLVILGGEDRAFQIDLYDETGQLVIGLKRDVKVFKKKKMQVFVDGELVSVVRLKRTFVKPLLSINDVADQPVVRVKGPLASLGTCKYDLITLDKKSIGSITKTWRGLANELFTDAEQFHISFPVDLDVRYKAAVIGTCIMIDIQFYSVNII